MTVLYKLDNLGKTKIKTLFTTNSTSSAKYTLNENLSNFDIIICNMWVGNSYYEGCYVDTVHNFSSRKRPAFISGTSSGSRLRFVNDLTVSWDGGYALDIVGIKF